VGFNDKNNITVNAALSKYSNNGQGIINLNNIIHELIEFCYDKYNDPEYKEITRSIGKIDHYNRTFNTKTSPDNNKNINNNSIINKN